MSIEFVTRFIGKLFDIKKKDLDWQALYLFSFEGKLFLKCLHQQFLILVHIQNFP